MDFDKYINAKKEIQIHLLQFLENEDDDESCSFQDFIDFFEKQKNNENKREEITSFLHLIVEISNNHRRPQNFFAKIKQIIQHLKTDIINLNLSNSEIFNITKYSKQLLLILFDMNIITVDDFIINIFFVNQFLFEANYLGFFFNEIENFLDETNKKEIQDILLENDPNIFDDFDKKRRIGENDSYICELIRNDSIDEFVTYVHKTNLQLSTKIKTSVFETNVFLYDKNPSLIEYASFFGSIQIFQYLRLNGVDLDLNLLLYAIHSNNAELIHILEENDVKPNDENNVKKFLEESIKCHHNNIANYIDNLSSYDHIQDESMFECIFKHYNYSFFPDNFYDDSNLYFFIKFDYCELVKNYLQTKRIECNNVTILKSSFNKVSKNNYF